MTQYPEANPRCKDCGELRQACTCEKPKQVTAPRFVRLAHPLTYPHGTIQWAAFGSELYDILIVNGWVEKPWDGSDER